MNEQRLSRAHGQSRRRSARERRAGRGPINTKWVSAFLAIGIVALAGGAIFAATRPTWHPSPAEQAAAASKSSVGTGASVSAESQSTLLGTGRALASMPTRTRDASPSPTRASSITYTVKSGDTLSGIAEWFKLHGYGRLYAANKMVIGSDPNLIIPGERITISHGVMSLHHSKERVTG